MAVLHSSENDLRGRKINQSAEVEEKPDRGGDSIETFWKIPGPEKAEGQEPNDQREDGEVILRSNYVLKIKEKGKQFDRVQLLLIVLRPGRLYKP